MENHHRRDQGGRFRIGDLSPSSKALGGFGGRLTTRMLKFALTGREIDRFKQAGALFGLFSYQASVWGDEEEEIGRKAQGFYFAEQASFSQGNEIETFKSIKSSQPGSLGEIF